MEFLPVLDPVDRPKEGIWYSLIPNGSAPGVSVGHTCMFVPSEDERKGRILIVGGANPSGSFSESYVLNLDEEPRWKNVEAKGELPSPRTYHTNSACIGDKLYVFSGGEAGAAPVSDAKLHVFDTVTSTWFQPETQGRQPASRHGHVIAAVCSKIFIHGGMAGDKFFNDMYSLDSGIMKWEKVQSKGDIPPGVAAHSAVVQGTNIYIFGGMTVDGAINSMHRFNTEKKRWTLMKFEDLPPNRLDHSMCLLPWQLCREGDADGKQTDSSDFETINLAFIFGGMDTQGVIYNDCIVTVVK
ncbi:rab9 effector protein with kelch motifs isoform X2 [Girardinichthys multiradiatus]|uniref:rab9 effector protein with kelch motifs isoform X2 n=1 Tax=Girardinichthys multiradiatus TaxID=208333 RepID=UPI001FAE26C1|nr:rab9 effector protein with kelch motifs isoform X2 [Girardinichthys multiradiatus]